MFLKDRLPKTLRQFNPIPLTYKQAIKNGERKGNNGYEINIYLGASLNKDGDTIINDGKGIFIGKPVLYENGEKKALYPNEARLKNLTYSAPIFCSINIQFIIRDGPGKPKEVFIKSGEMCIEQTYKVNGKLVPVLNLTRIPIILHSNAQRILRNMPRDVLYQMGECPYDAGGYFLINGKEKSYSCSRISSRK